MSCALRKMQVGEHLLISPSQGLGFQLDSGAAGEILFICQGTGFCAGMDLIAHIADNHFCELSEALHTSDSTSSDRPHVREATAVVSRRASVVGNRRGSDSGLQAPKLSISVIACFESPAHAIHRNHFDQLHERCLPFRIHWNFRRREAEDAAPTLVAAPSELPESAAASAAPLDDDAEQNLASSPRFGWLD